MGSALGRRRCCQSYFEHGYKDGFDGQGGDQAAEGRALLQAARTVSKSLAGLYRAGFEMGVKDRKEGKKRDYGYYDHVRAKKKLGDVLNPLDQGFTLIYAPTSIFPNHPWQLSSETGLIVVRRSVEELEIARDYHPHRLTIVKALAEHQRAQTEIRTAKHRRMRADLTIGEKQQ